MPATPDLVRVRLENGTHATMHRSAATAAGLTLTGGPARSRDGRPLPTVARTTVSRAVAVAAGRSRPTPTRRTASKSKED